MRSIYVAMWPFAPIIAAACKVKPNDGVRIDSSHACSVIRYVILSAIEPTSQEDGHQDIAMEMKQEDGHQDIAMEMQLTGESIKCTKNHNLL